MKSFSHFKHRIDERRDAATSDDNIIMQLRSAEDLDGNKEIKFRRGTSKVDVKDIRNILKAYDKINKPEDKRRMRIMLSKSPDDLKKIASMVSEQSLDKDSDDPCWDGYVQLGTKKKDGKEVPNCVPMESSEEITESKELQRAMGAHVDKFFKSLPNDLKDKLKAYYEKNPQGTSQAIFRMMFKEEHNHLKEKLSVDDGIKAWIKDFQESDAPQFKGKSKEERRDMAIAAYLDAEEKSKKSTRLWNTSQKDLKSE